MPNQPTFLLRYPWGLYDSAARVEFSATKELRLPVELPWILAIPAGIEAGLVGRQGALQPEGPPFKYEVAEFRLFSLPGATTAGRTKVTLNLVDPLGEGQEFWLDLSGELALNPGEPVSVDLAESSDDPRGRLLGLVFAIAARMQELYERLQPIQNNGNGRGRTAVMNLKSVALELINDYESDRDPMMDLIVKHAQALRSTVRDTGERPRKELSRVRRNMAISRIQEMDSVCLMSYVRRPGRTMAEKAGSRQQLMAVDRLENHDTLENRVLKDFLEKSRLAASDYLKASAQYSKGARYSSVRSYLNLCRRLYRQPVLSPVAPLVHKPTPNYVLQFDPRYKAIWKAYQELIQQQKKRDEIWRWQSRAWEELVRLCVYSALFFIMPDEEPPAVSPLLMQQEQVQGRWTRPISQLAVFLLPMGLQTAVLVPIDCRTLLSHHSLSDLHYSLGPTMVIRASRLGGSANSSLFVWALHGRGAGQPDLQAAVESAKQALMNWKGRAAAKHGASPAAAGLILMSSRDLLAEPGFADGGSVVGLSFAPTQDPLTKAIDKTGNLIERLVGKLLS